MRKTKAWLWAILVIVLIVIVLIELKNSNSPFIGMSTLPVHSTYVIPVWPVDIPELVQQTHQSPIFEVSWFEQPYPNYYHRLRLWSDGYIRYWRVVERIGTQEVNSGGQLSIAEMAEVQSWLEKILTMQNMPIATDATIITLSFLWRGENHILSFDSSRCPQDLYRLFEMADTAFERHPDMYGKSTLNPCQTTAQSISTRPIPSSQETTPLTVYLPEPVEDVHVAPALFRTTWYELPFNGLYYKLLIFADDTVVVWKFTDKNRAEEARGQLTAAERQETKELLLNSLGKGTDNLEEGRTERIILSFTWEADYHLFIFDNLTCSKEYRDLLEIAKTAFARSDAQLDGLLDICR